MMHELRKSVKGEEFDYQLLLNFLREYKKPRDKISRLLLEKDIIRVKKGLYVFGERWSKEPLSREVLANLIYGPSYISLEYALSFWGLIPERVEWVTSITSEKTKMFKTPVGVFSYKHLDIPKYSVGMLNHQMDDHHFMLIASKEKALADKVAAHPKFHSLEDLKSYLFEDLRIEESDVAGLNSEHMSEISKAYNNISINFLQELIKGV